MLPISRRIVPALGATPRARAVQAFSRPGQGCGQRSRWPRRSPSLRHPGLKHPPLLVHSARAIESGLCRQQRTIVIRHALGRACLPERELEAVHSTSDKAWRMIGAPVRSLNQASDHPSTDGASFAPHAKMVMDIAVPHFHHVSVPPIVPVISDRPASWESANERQRTAGRRL
jgi:hypothetical protein